MEEELQGVRVLVIDDSKTIRRSAENLLTKEGCDVITADDGNEAMEMAEEESPDLIIMDIMLPGVSGLDLVRTMKADDKLKDTPIIVVTTMAMAGDQEKIKAAGADAYLPKPIQVDEFIEAVRKILGG